MADETVIEARRRGAKRLILTDPNAVTFYERARAVRIGEAQHRGQHDPATKNPQGPIGREFSLEGMLDSFTQRKNVTVNLNTPRRA